MTTQEFFQNVVLPKVLVKDNHLENKAHMLLGLTSELLDELKRGMLSGDSENVKQELGDAEFFTIGLLYFYGYDILEFEDLEKMCSEMTDMESTLEDQLFQTIGIISSILKKEIVSGVLKYEKDLLSPADHAKYIYFLHFLILSMTKTFFNYDIEVIRNMISVKLNVRYKDGYSAEEDLNRNVETEDSEMSK